MCMHMKINKQVNRDRKKLSIKWEISPNNMVPSRKTRSVKKKGKSGTPVLKNIKKIG
jgi:hypothetical protein